MIRPPLRMLSILLASLAVWATSAMAAEPSGTAVKVDTRVDASGRLLQVEGAVFMGDELVSNPSGLAQIRFVDNTRIVVGPNSRLKIDRFVFDPNNTAKDVSIYLAKGFLRFISGKSPHEAYKVSTPTIAIGVRGTIFDVNARGPDSSVVFLQGAGELCDNAGACVPIRDDCTLFVAPRDGGIYNPTGMERRQRLSVFFPFIASQSGLVADFRARIRGCGSTTMFPGSAGETKDRVEPRGGSGQFD